MRRRGFLGRALAAGLAWAVGEVRTVGPHTQDESHLFDWGGRDAPFTDHPRHAGRLARGPHNLTLLDGAPVQGCLRYRTGEEGWVETYVRLSDGGVALEAVERASGRVVARDAADRRVGLLYLCDPGRYLVRQAVRVRYGHVVYRDLRQGPWGWLLAWWYGRRLR